MAKRGLRCMRDDRESIALGEAPAISRKRMDELLSSVAAKKERLDAIRSVSREALLALQKYCDGF